MNYWVVKLKEDLTSIGIITLMKRDYLDHPDIGFAFLPGYNGHGYAYEAADDILKNIFNDKKLPHILATTMPENIRSVNLLKKLGLRFEKEIENDNTKLHVYGMPAVRI